MERIEKRFLESLVNEKKVLIGFFDYEEFKQLSEGYLHNTTLSLYGEVYNVDDEFVDRPYIVLFNKNKLPKELFQKVQLVENPTSIYEKNDNDLEEYKALITRVNFEPDFYYIRRQNK